MLRTVVLHQLLTTVKSKVTVLAGKVSSSPTSTVQQQHEFLNKSAIVTCRFNFKQISAAVIVLIEVEPSLEGDVADGAADPPVSHQLGQVSFLQYFGGRTAPWTTNISLDRLDFFEKLLPQWLHWTGEQGRAESGRSSSALGGCLLKAFSHV